MAIAVNERTGKAYVINRLSNSVSVLDGRSVIATIPTGTGPEGIAIHPGTNRIYIATANDSAVTVIDGSTDRVIGTVKTGNYCQALAVDTERNKIYVANNFGHSVTVIDGATHETTTVRSGQGPRAIVVNAATGRVYTANYGSKDSTEITSNEPRSIPTGKHPWAIAADPTANKVYVVNEDSANVSIIDGATGAVRNVMVGEIPFAVAADAGRAYVLTYGENLLAVIDGRKGNVLRSVPLSGRPSAIAVNGKTNELFVSFQKSGEVQVLDSETFVVKTRIQAGTIPYAVAVDSSRNQAYVANFSSANVTVIPSDVKRGPGTPKFRVVALAERASGDHQSFVDAAKVYLNKLAAENGFAIDYITGTERLNEERLSQYKLFIQLNYPPYHWAPVAKAAFVKYIEEGRGGWLGFHHASLLGDFDGYPMDPWFSDFLGGIRFTHYLPDFAKATVRIEDTSSPLAAGLPASWTIDKEEWYTWDKSPRPNARVLATVDESSYVPNTLIKMGGDHPVVWSNSRVKARNLYIFMGHHAGLFDDPNFVRLFRNAVFWGAGQ